MGELRPEAAGASSIADGAMMGRVEREAARGASMSCRVVDVHCKQITSAQVAGVAAHA